MSRWLVLLLACAMPVVAWLAWALAAIRVRQSASDVPGSAVTAAVAPGIAALVLVHMPWLRLRRAQR